jgi:hypothetical protein
MIKGAVSWELKDNTGATISSGEKQNVVTNNASILLAWMMKNTGNSVPESTAPTRGAYYLYYGFGNASWDVDGPPLAASTQVNLVQYTARVIVDQSKFLVNGGEEDELVPTNQIRLAFAIDNPSGSPDIVIREMGLVGGNVKGQPVPYTNQTDPREYDLLLNYVTFGKITVTDGSRLNWNWDLTF